MLSRYGWYEKNSGERTRPVGGKKPNDLGLFDMHGNVWTWCQEGFKDAYPAPKGGEPIDDKEDLLQIISTNSRLLRGDSFYNQASIVRSAYRNWFAPSIRSFLVGLRPARTFTP